MIFSAIDKVDVGDAAAFRTALEAADFASVRGALKFGNNHHPIQNIYVREVIAGDGKPTNKLVGVAEENHQDTSGEIMVFVILGGVGRLFGPVAGAALFVALEHVLGGLTEHWQLLLGLILLGVVLFARGGLVGIVTGNAKHG